MTGHLCLKWNNHSSAFVKSISNIQINERFCDATIVCQGKYFPVHRVVLCTCSEYFDEMFERMQCQHPYIVFKDIEPSEMELLLNYMYQGEVNVVQESLPTLIKAAEALKIKGLAVPDDLPNNKDQSSSKRKSTSSSDHPTPKRRAEERRRRKESELNSSDRCEKQTDGSETDQNSSEKIVEIDKSETKIKAEPLDSSEYDDGGIPTDFGESGFDGGETSSAPLPSDNTGTSENVFVNFPLTEESQTFVKTENTLPVNETFNDQSSSSWNEFPSSEIMQDLPPETSGQDDICQVTHESENPVFKLSSENHQTKDGHQLHNSPDIIFRQCPFCIYKSPRNSDVKRHILYKHTSDRQFPCSFCPKRFAVKHNLRIHLRIHTGERPYKCPFCFQSFNQKGNLNVHIKSKHRLN